MYSLFLFSETTATSIIMCSHRMSFINFADFIIIISGGAIQMNHLWKEGPHCISTEPKETYNISLDYLIIKKLPPTE